MQPSFFKYTGVKKANKKYLHTNLYNYLFFSGRVLVDTEQTLIV